MTTAQTTRPPHATEIAAGAWLHNPVTGELARMNVGPADTAGRRVNADLWLRPGAALAGAHVHDRLVERFEVLAGRVGFQVAGVEHAIEAGAEAITVPAGVAHDWWNAGDDVAHVRVEVRARSNADGRPAARFVLTIEALWSLAALGRVNAKGMPDPLWLAAVAREYRDTIRFVRPPAVVQAVLFGPLAVLARRTGRDPLAPELHGPAAACAIPAPDDDQFRELLARPVSAHAAGKFVTEATSGAR